MKVRGEEVLVYGEVDGALRLIVYGLTAEADVSGELMEVGSAEAGRWRRSRRRKSSWRGSMDGLLSVEENRLEDILRGKLRVIIGKVYTDAGAIEGSDTAAVTGDAFVVRWRVTGRSGGMVSVHMELEGCGRLVMNAGDWVLMSGYWEMKGVWYDEGVWVS